MRLASFAPLMLFVTLAGCAARGPFPSLAPRAVEKELAALDEAKPVPTVLPDDPAVAAQTNALLAEARRGQGDFETASSAAEKMVRAAGSAGSDSWVEAQQAVSRLEAVRTRTATALGDLDAFVLERAQATPPLSAADFARIEAVIAEVQAIAARQQERIAALQSSLAPA
jgi:hypothetical protein